MNNKYYEAVKTLGELFDQFNEYLFNNEVEKPVITISPDTTSGAYGWCTTQKIWKSETEEYYEINICAEHDAHPYEINGEEVENSRFVMSKYEADGHGNRAEYNLYFS